MGGSSIRLSSAFTSQSTLPWSPRSTVVGALSSTTEKNIVTPAPALELISVPGVASTAIAPISPFTSRVTEFCVEVRVAVRSADERPESAEIVVVSTKSTASTRSSGSRSESLARASTFTDDTSTDARRVVPPRRCAAASRASTPSATGARSATAIVPAMIHRTSNPFVELR